MIVTVASLFLSTLRFENLPFLSYPSSNFFILFCILNYGKLRWRRFLCCISAAFSNSSQVLYGYGPAPARVCAENLEGVHWGFPVVHLCSTVCVAVSRAGSISGDDKDLGLYSEWLAGNPILKNTVGMSHQNTWEDRSIYRTPFHSAIVSWSFCLLPEVRECIHYLVHNVVDCRL